MEIEKGHRQFFWKHRPQDYQSSRLSTPGFEIVSDGESGLLVPERDVESLANALETLLNQPERWAEMGKVGRNRIEERHAPTVAKNLEDVYQNVSSRNGSVR